MPDLYGDGPQGQKFRWRNGRQESKGHIGHQKKRGRDRRASQRRRNIGIIDFETDRFDNVNLTPVFPFLAVVYSDRFAPIIIWDNDHEALLRKLVAALDALDEPYTFYAHNGGRFDYMFLMRFLLGRVKFKGRALMSAKLGKHEIRDSLHIIPESLRNANRKTDIDYAKFDRSLRDAHRQEITDYCLEDCIATFEIVRSFINKFGLPISIGQAATTELKRHYTIRKLNAVSDSYIRQFFYGGRVECFVPPGKYAGPLKLYDVNSMYPDRMTNCSHPIGASFEVNNKITRHTAFIHLTCQNNGIFVSRATDGSLTTGLQAGEFRTTIHEYKTAIELDLISDIKIIKTVDFAEWSRFGDFIKPLYERRAEIKDILEADDNHPNKRVLEQDAKFHKYFLLNAWGKQAQNPRKFKEYYLTSPGDRPPENWLYYGLEEEIRRTRPHTSWGSSSDMAIEMEMEDARRETARLRRLVPVEETDQYWIWAIPAAEWRFNNVATGASITGSARAKLAFAKHHAVYPLYCDTDSLICSSLGSAVDIHPSQLGAWKCETEISEAIIGGKKLYAYRTPKYDGKTLDKDKKLVGEKVRAKGLNGVTWTDLEAIVSGRTVAKTMFAPTISRTGKQHYMVRELRATGMGL